jgi:hypothetical protein
VSRRSQQVEQGGLDEVLLEGSEAEVEAATHHEDEEASPAAEVQQEEAQEVVSAQVQTEELPVVVDEASVVAVVASELCESSFHVYMLHMRRSGKYPQRKCCWLCQTQESGKKHEAIATIILKTLAFKGHAFWLTLKYFSFESLPSPVSILFLFAAIADVISNTSKSQFLDPSQVRSGQAQQRLLFSPTLQSSPLIFITFPNPRGPPIFQLPLFSPRDNVSKIWCDQRWQERNLCRTRRCRARQTGKAVGWRRDRPLQHDQVRIRSYRKLQDQILMDLQSTASCRSVDGNER